MLGIVGIQAQFGIDGIARPFARIRRHPGLLSLTLSSATALFWKYGRRRSKGVIGAPGRPPTKPVASLGGIQRIKKAGIASS